MRIGFSSFVFDHGQSGIASYIFGLLQGLQTIDSYNQYEILAPAADISELPIFQPNFRTIPSKNFVSQPILNIAWHNVVLPWMAKSRGYNLIHIPTIRRIPYIKGCRLIGTVHDLAPWVIPNKYDVFRTFYHRKILKHAIYSCDHVIAVSQTTKRDIVTFTGYPEEKISVIYSGIDKDAFKNVGRSEAKSRLAEKYGIKNPFLVYVSRIEHPGKNHLSLIKAFEILASREATPYHLILAGADWNGASVVKEYAAASPFKERIHFLGFIPKAEVIDLYTACDLMVFPSLYEGFGFPLIEALASGAPVLCSRIPVFEEIGEHYVDFFDPHSPEEIAVSMYNRLNHSQDAQKTKQAVAYASSFDWSKCAQEVLKLYSLVGRS